MHKYEKIKVEIDQLIKEGVDMYDCFREYLNSQDALTLKPFIDNYEMWYTKALMLVKQILPQRYDDFVAKYKNEKRKEISRETYTISDALHLIMNKQLSLSYAAMPLYHQIEIVKACRTAFDSEIFNMQVILQADIFDSEIESARHLLKMGFLRAAGAVCGVVIEKHFCGVSSNHKIVLKKKSPTIADYNDALKDNVYDTMEWRRIQRLGDIRNLCDHSKDREPTKEEVEELISGTERVTKTIF